MQDITCSNVEIIHFDTLYINSKAAPKCKYSATIALNISFSPIRSCDKKTTMYPYLSELQHVFDLSQFKLTSDFIKLFTSVTILPQFLKKEKKKNKRKKGITRLANTFA
ncbi:hypothetical protein CHS0354_004569 [Potamilus streckersoni]|uniref:Uncharacterized protein n=1 Tax=Potamilus streckersoni TaxID=2493646 RepID=A0AAE0VQN2_9BIVA|nr:hypothetical protein CHS0354_004569 [Potamilus streckersoni]